MTVRRHDRSKAKEPDTTKFCDTQAEQALLGLMILSPDDVIPSLKDLGLSSQHFYWQKHRKLYELLLEMHEAGEAIDLVTVHARVAQKELAAEIPASYLGDCASKATLPEYAKTYAEIILDRHRRWQLYRLGQETQEVAVNGLGDGELARLIESLQHIKELKISPKRSFAPEILQSFQELPEGEECEWIVQDLLPTPRVVGLGGKRASFKTFLALHISLCVCTGTPVFGRYPVLRPGSVLFLNEENPKELIGARARAMTSQLKILPGEDGLGELWTCHFAGWNLRDRESFEALKALIKEKAPVLLVIDSLARIWGVQDEVKNVEIAQAMQRLRDLCEEFGLTILFLHHLRKTIAYGEEAGDFLEALRGGSEIVNLADSVFVLQRKRGEPVVILKHGKSRDGQELRPFRLRMETLEEDGKAVCKWIWDGEVTEAEEKLEACMEEILEWFEEQPSQYEASRKEIVNLLKEKYSRVTIDRALKSLLEAGNLIQPLRGRYSLPDRGLFEEEDGEFDDAGHDS